MPLPVGRRVREIEERVKQSLPCLFFFGGAAPPQGQSCVIVAVGRRNPLSPLTGFFQSVKEDWSPNGATPQLFVFPSPEAGSVQPTFLQLAQSLLCHFLDDPETPLLWEVNDILKRKRPPKAFL